MKKILYGAFLFVLAIASVFAFSSCAEPEEEYEITFNFSDGRENLVLSVTEGELIKNEAPTRSGYVFVGWCTDQKLSNFYDFTKAPTSDMTLYAKWTLNYEKLVSDISRESASFNVKVMCSSFKDLSASPDISQGSGVIYQKKDGYYYVLTNNHVADGSDSAFLVERYVYDMYGYEYKATLIKADPAYDLAVLKIKARDSVSLGVAKIKTELPSLSDKIVSVTSPQGQINAIEFGEVIAVKPVSNDGAQTDASNVSFDVLWLTSYSNHGSSGGAVLDTNLNVIGIVYGVATTGAGTFKYTFAIPGAKAIEFLNSIEN